MKFRLIVFDWDGTLMDSEARIVDSMLAALRDTGQVPPGRKRICGIIGLELGAAVRSLLPGAGEALCGRVVERYRYHYLSASDTPAPLFPGAREVVAELSRQDYLLAVATGKGRRGLDQAMSGSGLEGCFHATRCPDEARSKPHPDMLLQIMDELGVEPGETLMIGDTVYDMQLAQNAGTAALAVSYGVERRERMLQMEPLGCVDAVSEIPGWVSRNRLS